MAHGPDSTRPFKGKKPPSAQSPSEAGGRDKKRDLLGFRGCQTSVGQPLLPDRGSLQTLAPPHPPRREEEGLPADHPLAGAWPLSCHLPQVLLLLPLSFLAQVGAGPGVLLPPHLLGRRILSS